MRRQTVFAALATLGLACCLLLPSAAQAKPFCKDKMAEVFKGKKQTDAFLGNPPKTYPHIHCIGDTKAVYSASSKQHTNLFSGSVYYCPAINQLSAQPPWQNAHVAHPEDLKRVIDLLKVAGAC